MLPLWKGAGGIEVARLTSPEEVAELIHLFENVAAAEGWEPAGALREWTERSVYFALMQDGALTGGLQLVLPDCDGTLPYQAIWPEVLPTARRKQAHVAVLALDEEFRGQSLLFWRLVCEMWRHCVGEGLTTLSIEVTPRVLPLYWRLGWPLVVKGELRRHWGEDCYCCFLGIPEVAEALLRRAEHSGYYQEVIAQAFRVSLRTSPSTSASTAAAPW